jgi:hypothetical protein
MRILACALLLMSSVLSAAQEKKGMWQRVYTGEDSIIEINVSKVTFVEYSAARKVTFTYSSGRVGFRTIYSKPEALREKSGARYKTRLETIEFQCDKKEPDVLKRVPSDTTSGVRYRLYEATLLDEKGKPVKTFAWDPSAEWKEIKRGGMMDKLSGAACTLINEKRRNQ